MSASRPPSTPPTIAGFDYVQLLGKGGFADVFLYQQQMPKRRVAVKVLLADAMNPSAIADFKAEANTMAQFSTHPAIVTIYHADVAPDGRPYLVMEHCPKPNLQARYRKAPFSVAEALRVGIQVSGAVQTAHRAGILHRDIKPANILVTEYNRPALADFGIAATQAGSEESLGMSPPWSPPEAFASPPVSNVATDLWALGATVYTLLAGRSPFEVPGQKNSTADVIARIQHEPLRPIDRADVPTSLQTVFATSMAKDPARRYSSAVDFARALQKVQIELAMSVTPFDVIDDSAEDLYDEPEDDGRTRVRSVVSIDPQGPGPSAFPSSTSGYLSEVPFSTTDAAVLADSTGTPLGDAPVSDATVVRRDGATPSQAAGAPPVSLPDDATLGRTQVRPRPAPASAEAEPAPEQRRSKAPLFIGVGAAVVVVGGVVTAAMLGLFSSTGEDTPPAPTSVVPQDDVVVAAQVPIVEDIVGTIEADTAVFTWEAPDPEPGDTFLWGVRVGEAAVAYESTEEPTASVPYEGQEVCIEVLLRRADGRTGSTPGVGCTP
ncbi:serine/threonine protein kinase [Demequina sp. TTPB684]|uniref:serine/threonine-protein kinase n=1 Tax=unclassified Demequina TaxID=2620311 RepID=UPI001CF47087|nr:MULTISPECIES: serine/threonine-protein kinase [unclassified Demequina]MCB2413190.1 serine/threonine protein kinase [Demequina sp. TTPB684]UPU88365.1 serine/threonine protein kinase [Demequina sp. TMPB413]